MWGKEGGPCGVRKDNNGGPCGVRNVFLPIKVWKTVLRMLHSLSAGYGGVEC